MSDNKKYGKGEWIGAAVLAGIMFIGFAWWQFGSDDKQAEIDRAENERNLAKFHGLQQCRKMIESLAVYGKDNDPGSTGGVVEDGVVWFSWPHGSFHFQNAFGAAVPQSARCAVKEDTGEVLSLAVSGQIVTE